MLCALVFLLVLCAGPLGKLLNHDVWTDVFVLLQGVFMLNTVLTVRKSEANSHSEFVHLQSKGLPSQTTNLEHNSRF